MRIETVLAPLVTLLVLAIEAAVAGGAFAFGAWVVWRLLERRRALPPPPRAGGSVLLPALIIGLSLFGAIIFGLGANTTRPVPWYLSVLPFVPFLVFSLLGCGAVWVVRRALRGAPQ